MINLLRNSNPFAIILMVAVAIMPLFLGHESIAISNQSGQTSFMFWFQDAMFQFRTGSPFLFNFCITASLLLEATFMNRIVSEYRLMEKPGFLPGFCFLLLNLISPSNITAALILINGLLLIALRLLVGTYKAEKPNNGILISSFILGLINAMDSRYFLVMAWLAVALLIMRPVSLREFILAVIGYVLPFYFISAWLYLTDGFSSGRILPPFELQWNLPQQDVLDWTKTLLMILLPWLGLIASSNQVSKLLIQGRKSILVTLSLLLALQIMLCFDITDLAVDIQSVLGPSALLTALFFVSFKKQLLPNLVILILVVLAVIR